jgi:hypothetical protein
MELDLRHPELFANPIHLLAVHLHKLYGHSQETSTVDTLLLHYNSIYVILAVMARETFSGAQTLGMSRIMCWGRVVCLLDHLTETDRCSRVAILRTPTNSADSQRATPSKAFCVCTFQRPPRKPAHQHSSRLACAHFSERRVLVLAPKAFELEPRSRRVSSSTTAMFLRLPTVSRQPTRELEKFSQVTSVPSSGIVLVLLRHKFLNVPKMTITQSGEI